MLVVIAVFDLYVMDALLADAGCKAGFGFRVSGLGFRV